MKWFAELKKKFEEDEDTPEEEVKPKEVSLVHQDLIGKVFGKWTILARIEGRFYYYKVRCS